MLIFASDKKFIGETEENLMSPAQGRCNVYDVHWAGLLHKPLVSVPFADRACVRVLTRSDLCQACSAGREEKATALLTKALMRAGHYIVVAKPDAMTLMEENDQAPSQCGVGSRIHTNSRTN